MGGGTGQRKGCGACERSHVLVTLAPAFSLTQTAVTDSPRIANVQCRKVRIKALWMHLARQESSKEAREQEGGRVGRGERSRKEGKEKG